ncbi:hypothetical protein EYZ11_005729 [Aspergillus tanneri]|uniref:Uncharacterized protein n=1 Tax=Aspergillus tanneri TaxID=1220188 RepID=A0A4S3JHD6_9EURO|nr:hypothetical protein EYZ11_005729 [Aspergillus tanneri]
MPPELRYTPGISMTYWKGLVIQENESVLFDVIPPTAMVLLLRSSE